MADLSGDGTAQPQRFSRGLEDGYFRVDETGFAELVSLASRYAGNLRYEPEPGVSGGTWADLFTTDPVFALAELSTLSIPRQGALLRLFVELRDPVRLASFVRFFAFEMDACFRALERSDQPEIEGLRARFEQLMRERADDLRVAQAILDARVEPGQRRRAFPWHRVWSENVSAAEPEAASAEPDLARLELACHHFLHAFAHLKHASDGLLDRTLHTGTRQPALGLALTFFELFAKAQASLNEFSRKRLEFYYLDVLRFAPRGRVPDQAYITLGAAPGVRELFIPAATEFSAGRDERKNELIFVSTDDLRLTDARVDSIATVQLDCDNLVSPERELGFATRIRAQRVGREHVDLQGQRPTPLFRAVGEEGTAVLGEEATLGFAIASPLLELREGRRRIRFRIELSVPDNLEALAADLERAGPEVAPDEFFRRFGKLFTKLVMTSPADASEAAEDAEARAALVRAAERVLRGERYEDSLRTIRDLLARDRGSVFHDLFRRAFAIRWTGERGWQDVAAHHVAPRADGVGLDIVIELGPEAAPIVAYDPTIHGAGYDTRLPMVAFRVGSDAIFHPYSLLRSLDLHKVTIQVEVKGATGLFAYNQLGAVDPTKVFQPFGPLPTRDSFLVFGSYEAARKPLRKASIEIEWSALPRERGGWRQHYRGYDREISEDTLKAEIAVLRDSEWQPADAKRKYEVRLFTSTPGDDRIVARRTLQLNVMDYYQPILPTVSPEEFRTFKSPRDGLFRLSLAPSDTAFGHLEYPQLLTRTLSANANPKQKDKLAIPNAPYTPLINSMRLSYTAESVIRAIARGGDAELTTEKIFHEHPFGAHDLADEASDRRFSLMPGGPSAVRAGRTFERGGYLFLGLSGTQPLGTVTLLVHMVGDTALRSDGGEPDVVWYYLAANQWHALDPHRVVSDSTRGMLTSGIVKLDLPDDLAPGNTLLPAELSWIAIGTDRLESIVSRLHSITAGAVRVVWQDRDNLRPSEATELPPGSIRSSFRSIVGLETVRQVGATFGGRPAEDYRRVLTRASERLRHKNRASTPWDYERLTLERFPDLQKVKCFPNVDVRRYPEQAPGSVLVVVVPRLIEPTGDETALRLVSGAELDLIAEVLRGLAPPGARIAVRNPAYEVVQLRCRVKLAPRVPVGPSLQRINQALIDYIAPWRPDGRGGSFGWSIRGQDVAGFIHDLPFVEFVTGLSLLHISEDKDRPTDADRFAVGDTGLAPDAATEVSTHSVRGRYPWSLAMPSRRHFIQAESKVVHVPAEGTGIGDLEIGRNFIVKGTG